MSNSVTRILLVEDDIEDVDLIKEYLERSRQFLFSLETTQTVAASLKRLQRGKIDLVLTDLSLPDEQGLATFRAIKEQFPHIPVIILSGLDHEEMSVAAMQEGAQDYLVKGYFDSHLLIRAIRYALERQQLFLDLDRRVEQRTAQLKKANEELQAKDSELRNALMAEKRLNQLKSQIITTVSHEYRTPLAVISSSAGLLHQYRQRLDEQKQLKHLKRIQQSVQHMNSLISDVMFISRAELEKVKFDPQPLNIIAFLDEIADEFRLILDDNCSIELTIDGEWGQFWADAKLLRQILTNLLSNAIKYSPSGGTISLILAREDNDLVFQICDEGIGIPAEDQPYLFESFNRATNVGTIPGTGLGLSIVKKAVEQHKGQITVESQVGAGTTFTVRLPNCSPHPHQFLTPHSLKQQLWQGSQEQKNTVASSFERG